jgi:RimJ/RimL family protein N-acetyltransferase
MCQHWIAAAPLRHGGGLIYLSSISERGERIGTTHVMIWNKEDMGSPDDCRLAASQLVQDHGLDRLVGEIDVGNRLAINLAKRAGFREIGIVRHRKTESGDRHDVLLLDALPEDLENG